MPVFQRERLTRAEITVVRAVATLAGRRRSAAVLVGGAVRDAWLGRRPGREVDLDVAVPAGALDLARRVAERLRGAFVPLDPERGTGRVVLPGVRLDVTDFRGPSLAADLAARDFTVNALAVPLRELLVRGGAPIVDPTGGLADLRARRLRAPDLRVFTDDPLRALRGVRLEAALGFRLTRGTVAAIRAVAPALAAVAAERVRDELLLVLALPDTARAFRRMDALGLLGVLLPEVEPMRATAQPAPHRFPVLEHSLRALASADRVLARLATLVPFGEALRAPPRRGQARDAARGPGARQVLRARPGRRRARARHRSAAAPARAGGRGARTARAPPPAPDAPRRHGAADAPRALPLLSRPARGHAGSAAARAGGRGRRDRRLTARRLAARAAAPRPPRRLARAAGGRGGSAAPPGRGCHGPAGSRPRPRGRPRARAGAGGPGARPGEDARAGARLP